MCLNQIFKDEQLAIMRYASAPSGPDVATSLKVLHRLQLNFQAFPYPHRPYVPMRLPDQAAGRNSPSWIDQGSN